jgi:hypothetical protein
MKRVSLLCVLVALSSCDCSEPPDPPSAECVFDVDCADGEVCVDSACIDDVPISEGEGEEGEGEGEAGEGEGEVQLGVLAVLPEANVEFGAVRLGAPVERNVTLKNIGPVALTVIQLVIDDNDAGTFSAEPTGALNLVLEPDAELGVLLRHVPNDGVPDNAELKVLHTGEGQLTSVTLAAEFKGVSTLSVTADAAALDPDVTVVDLGDVSLGESRAVTVYVRNDGDADSVLTVDAATLTPANQSFSLAAPTLPLPLSQFDGLCGADVADCPPGTSACTAGVCVDAAGTPIDTVPLTVTFAPTTTDEREATITVRSDVGGIANSAFDIVVRARGVAGQLSIEPAQVTFTEVFAGRSARQTVRVANIGGAATTVQGASLLFPGTFTLEPGVGFPVVLAPSDEITVDVVFSPTGAGQFNNIIVWDVVGAATDPQTVVIGNARLAPVFGVYDAADNAIDVDAAAIDFGDVFLGRQAAQTVRIVNEGPVSSTLAIRRMVLEGAHPDRFTFAPTVIDNALPGHFNLAPNVPLTITYLPGALTGINDQATLVLETDDPDRPTIEIDLSGRAIKPILGVTPTAIDFGPVLVGTNPSPTRTVTLSHGGGVGPLVISAIDGPALAVYTMTTSLPLPATLAVAGDTMTVTLRYTPAQANVVASTNIVVHSSDLDRGPVTVSVVGSSGGCPPRDNANVTVVGDQCVYSCRSGFHECGDACLSNTSPDSCGSSCTPCDLRDNATRGCIASSSTCTYSCAADARDLNGTLAVPQGVSSDGCEYECPVFPTTTEQCLGGDQDCDGQVDEGLQADDFDRNGGVSVNTNDTCSVPDGIATVPEGGITTVNATIYPMPSIGGDDEDWYRVNVTEGTGFCVGDEDFRVTVRLTGIPSGSDYDLFLHNDDCGAALRSSENIQNANDTITFDYDGGCSPFENDDRTFRIRVKRFSGGSCDDYQLAVEFDGI